MDVLRNYIPAGPVIKSFHESGAFVRGVMGPLGSSKSTACVMEVLGRSSEQAPSPDGIRKSRWAIVRNSYPELKTTTIKTWTEWCPPQYGRLTWDSPITHRVQIGERDGEPGLDMEILFIALDRPEDQKKLLSLELTGAWFNEVREIPKAIIDAMTGRVGRYPAMVQGGASWSGIIMDTNPPDDQNWYYHAAEVETPEGWRFFRQPGGLTPGAENLANLPKFYYQRMVAGKDPDWIKVYVNAEYGFVTEGKAVYPMFRDSIHSSSTVLAPVRGISLLAGADFGLTPASIIGQKLSDGRWLILDEFCADSCGVTRFSELLANYVGEAYPDHTVAKGWGDPSGGHRGETDEKTSLEIMNANTHWKWKPAPSNVLTLRREVVVNALNRLVDGSPGILVSPKCRMLRKGFSGGYHFKYVQNANGTLVHELPHKNQYSHPHDALQYLLLGGGDHHVVLGREHKRRKSTDRAPIAKGADYDRLA